MRAEIRNVDQAGTRSAVHVTGDASNDVPMRLVLLVRHNDIADETSPERSRLDVHDCSDVLSEALMGVDIAPVMAAALQDVLVEANRSLPSDAYHSVLIGVITPNRVALAGIGNVSAQVWDLRSARSIIEPTIVQVGNVAVLSGALGVGFDAANVKSADLLVHEGERVVIAIDMKITHQVLAADGESPRQMVEAIIRSARPDCSSIVGVLG